MRGYPKGQLSKTDYENLFSMPEYATQAKTDLEKLAMIDDTTITVDQGTEKAPKLVAVANPLPAWKRAGFRDKIELVSLADTKIEPETDPEIKPLKM
jgi:hypothetical protein